jgi:dTDP-glucose 4,6-dehydratase
LNYKICLLLLNNHKVIDIDKITYASTNKLPHDLNNNYLHIKEDICDLKYLPECDYLVNFAAETHVDNSITSPSEFVRSNINGVFNLLELLRGKPADKRPLFVHISTDEVYGDCLDNIPHNEDDVLKPNNPYAATKAAAELLIRSYKQTYDIDYLITRSSNNYGERQYKEKLIPQIIECLKNNKSIPIHGTGEYYRDWIYVKDNVEAIYKLIMSKTKNDVYNICGENLICNLEIVKIVCSWFGIENYLEYIKFVPNRECQDNKYFLTNKKIKNVIDWNPKLKGIIKYYE